MTSSSTLRSKALALAGIMFATAPAFAADIPIGLVAPISGSVALDGQQEVAGARFAVSQFNAAGGLSGQKVELFVEDGECKPASSTAAAEKLITRNEIVALAGAFCSSSTKAVQPISEKYGVPFVNGISSDPSLTNPVRPWFFRTKIHNGIRGKFYAKFIAADMGLKKLVAIAVDDDFGRSAVTSFTPVLKEYGGEFVLVRYFKHGEVNYVSMLNAAKSAGADGLFLVGEAQDGALIMKQYHQLGLTLPVVALGSFNTPEFFNAAGADADAVYNAEVWGYGVDYPAAKTFVADWQKANNGAHPGLYAMSGYVEAKTILEGLVKAGAPDRTKIKAAMEGLSFDSPIGVITFDGNHQSHTLLFVTKNEGGQGVVKKTYDTTKE
jgi:branched-chain amino acid transport system substrate-binding protein